jgi:hypothetical protein
LKADGGVKSDFFLLTQSIDDVNLSAVFMTGIAAGLSNPAFFGPKKRG